MKTKILSILLVAIFVISTAAYAQPENRERNKNDQRVMMKRHLMQKGERQNFFTEDQKETMKKLRLETAKEIKPLKNELRELHAKQQTLTTADNADLKAINKNIDKMSELKAEMAKIKAKQHQQVRSMLSEEQLIKFDAMKERRGRDHRQDFSKNRMKKGMKHRSGRDV